MLRIATPSTSAITMVTISISATASRLLVTRSARFRKNTT